MKSFTGHKLSNDIVVRGSTVERELITHILCIETHTYALRRATGRRSPDVSGHRLCLIVAHYRAVSFLLGWVGRARVQIR